MTDFEFDAALAIVGEPGGARATLGEGWTVGPAVNGGILMALAGEAARAAVTGAGGHGDVLVLSAHFLSAALPGPARLDTEVLRAGRSTSTAQVSVRQAAGDAPDDPADSERMRALVTLGDLARHAQPVHRSTAPPHMPPPERCIRADRSLGGEFARGITMLDRVDLRLDPDTVGWAVGRPSGRGELRAWVRFADGREPDPLALLYFVDGLPPVSFDLGAQGWAPTIELTAHLRAYPAPGWLQVRVRSANVAGGLYEEDAELWDADGRLVAQSRQLAGLRMPGAA